MQKENWSVPWWQQAKQRISSSRQLNDIFWLAWHGHGCCCIKVCIIRTLLATSKPWPRPDGSHSEDDIGVSKDFVCKSLGLCSRSSFTPYVSNCQQHWRWHFPNAHLSLLKLSVLKVTFFVVVVCGGGRPDGRPRPSAGLLAGLLGCCCCVNLWPPVLVFLSSLRSPKLQVLGTIVAFGFYKAFGTSPHECRFRNAKCLWTWCLAPLSAPNDIVSRADPLFLLSKPKIGDAAIY